MEAGLGKYAFHGTSPRDLTSPPGVGNLLPMSNEYYAPGEQRAEQVNALFARIARRYDLINDLQSFRMHRRWKRRVAQLAVVHGPSARGAGCLLRYR